MVIKVCVGSSCHLKGSYDVIEAFKKILKKYDVEDLVDLQASFCLGYCSQGVTVKAEGATTPSADISNGEIFLHHINKDNVEDYFAKEIYPLIIK